MWRELRCGLAGPWSAQRQAQPLGWRAGRPVSLDQWLREAAGWHARLAALPGTAVALHFDDTLSAAAALFAAWHAGKVVWWPGDALPATAERLMAQGDMTLAGDWPGQTSALRNADAGDEPAAGWQALEAQAPQLVVFTSGSSGEPSAIVKKLHQLFDEVRALENEFGARLGDCRVEGTVSHQHIYGMLFRLLWPFAAGRGIAARRLAYLEDLHAWPGRVALVASPAHLKRLHGAPLAGLAERLAALFSSGGPLPQEALPDCAALLGQTPVEVYGASESGGVAWRQRAAGSDEQDAWRPLPNVEWRLEGERLWLRSPQLGHDEWFEAQDRARAEGLGFVLLGRVDRIVKIEEKRVSLAAIEQALGAGGEVAEMRLPVLPGRRQELGVVLVPSAAGWAAIDRLGRAAWLQGLRERLAPLLDATVRPRRWRVVSELPGNSQGKVTQAAMLALFDPLRPPARLLRREPHIASWLIEVEARLPAFDGHFPGHPVLPGVVQLDWAERFAREAFADLPPDFLGLDQLKFQQVIVPGQEVELLLERDAAQLRFELRSARGAHASGRLRFGAVR